MRHVGLDFEALLGRIWMDLRTKLGTKLDPSWHQYFEDWRPKTIPKNDLKTDTPGIPMNPAWGGGSLLNLWIGGPESQLLDRSSGTCPRRRVADIQKKRDI